MDDNGPLFYTVPEVADVLRVESTTIYRAIREDAFPAIRIRGRYIVPAEAIRDLAAVAAAPGRDPRRRCGVELVDDGSGTGATAGDSGHGLDGLAERVAAAGQCEAGDAPGGGFRLAVRVPR